MKREHKYYLKILTDIFDMKFSYRNFAEYAKKDESIYDIYHLLYYSWLSENLFVTDPISPYGLICELSDRFSPRGSLVFPFLDPNRSSRRLNICFKTISLKSHPVIDDLRIYTDALASGTVGESGSGKVFFNSSVDISKCLSQYSEDYLEYLHHLSKALGLYTSLPSVKIQIYKIRRGYEKFFEEKDIFDRILWASASVCSKKLNSMFSPGISLFTPEIIMHFVRFPCGTDDFFGSFFENFEADIGLLISEDFIRGLLGGEPEEMYVSSIFLIKSFVGKWFYTIFGYYLFLIRPYSDPYPDTYYSIQYFLRYGEDVRQNLRSAVFYAVPDDCFLTPLGRELFGLTVRSYSPITNDECILLPKLSLRETFEDIADYFEFELPKMNFVSDTIETYVLKIASPDKPKDIKMFEFSEYSPIDEIYTEIMASFSMRPIMGYSMYTDESLSPFSEYTNSLSGRTYKRTETTFMNEVFSDVGDKLWIVLKKQPRKDNKKQYYLYTAELIKKGIKTKTKEYPSPWRENQ